MSSDPPDRVRVVQATILLLLAETSKHQPRS